MYILPKDHEITKEELTSFIQDFIGTEQPRLVKLKRYYKSDNPGIMDQPVKDPHRPNNRIAHSFASYISDTMIGYFMGSPVVYSSEDEDTLEKIKMVNKINDEHTHNLRLERDASIYGIAYELQYVLRNGEVKFKDIDPRNAFVIYDDTLEQNILYFVRIYGVGLGGQEKYKVELYDDREKHEFEITGPLSTGVLKPVRSSVHGYKDVPVSVYANNRDRMGDFERVVPMIDAYDRIASSTLNDLENFADAYLVFKDVDIPGDTIEEQQQHLAHMRENRVIQYNGEGEVSWLTKEVADAGAWEGAQAKLEEQIYYMTGTPNFNDEAFSGNSSGVALKYKLQPIEQKASMKEREFKKGLERRLELLGQVIKILGNTFSPVNIDITFKRTLPTDLLYEMDFLRSGAGLVSHETLLSNVSFIDNPKEELAKLAEEEDDKLDFNFNFHETEEEVEETEEE